jgi:NitT/TauT family transport system permease protein
VAGGQVAGLVEAPDEALNLMRSLRASPWQILVKLRIPSALPAIFGGLQIGATLAIIGAIVSEFVAADAGLGFMMVRYRSSFNTAAVLC